MTTHQKDKINWWLGLIPKAITPALLIVIIWKGGIYYNEIRTLSFSSVESRVNTERHINSSLSEIELHELSEHINNPDFHMSKSAKDSIYVTRIEYEALVGRQAVTSYQTKESISEIKYLIKDIRAEISDVKKKLNN